MKTRHGFVSNSSSSSFLVVFDQVPTSALAMQKLLFGEEGIFCPHPGYYEAIETATAAATIFRDLQDHGPPLDKEDLVRAFESGTIEGEGAPDFNDFRKEGTYDWDAYNKALTEFSEKAAQRFLETAGSRPIYQFHYSDNDGPFFSTLEHGQVFRNLPHICISHH